MIAHLDTKYISECVPEWTAKLIATLAHNNHLIDCDDDAKLIIEQCVRNNCSTLEKNELFVNNALLYDRITSLKRNYLTTIEVDGSFTQNEYMNLFGEPSLVLLENAPYEWPVYKQMMDAYKNDRDYSNIYATVIKAANSSHRTLRELHAGGNGSIEALITSQEQTPEYKGLTKYKIYCVTDNDQNSKNAAYLPTPKKLYRFLCGIKDKNTDIDRKNIDTLNQPLYKWHMWLKRAIENYFPPEAYENIGLNADKYREINVSDRNFAKVDGNMIKGYDKKDIHNVAASMGRKDYEAISDKLIIEGKEISEIRLFLLKMAKVV